MQSVRRKAALAATVMMVSTGGLQGQDLPSVIVDVNLDVLHRIGDQDSMDRSRFITIHSNPEEKDWDGDNFTPDLRDHFLNGYDVYTGRSTGGIKWTLNSQAVEDPSRPGHVLPSNIQSLGSSSRANYANKTEVHPYEHRHNLVLCNQFHPFWPDGTLTNRGWALSQTDTPEEPFGTASGEFMGLYTQHFFGGNGPRPPYCLEIINEPLWELVTNGTTPASECFRFHNNVATEIRKHVPDIPIGGYTAAFPDFDKDNFQRWHERDKLFMDMSGEYMDFIAWHLYDFPAIGGKEKYRKGSNMEATFDMYEQYSKMTLGKVLPFEISEYGAQTHDYNNQGWSAYRDWLRLKCITPQLMSFLERPDKMLMTIPFTVVKAEWGRVGDIPYGPRLMRQVFEKDGETGDQWVYTELVLFYQLWSEVRGKRVDTRATDPDFLCDAYVDGKDAYIIISNLEFSPRTIGFNPSWTEGNTLESVNVKHQYLKNNYPVLETTDYQELPASLALGSEAAMVVKLSYTEPLAIPDSSLESKYYATTYLQEIQANTQIPFQVGGVVPGEGGEAVLRLGIGRDHGLSLTPELMFNGTAVEVPEDFRGGPQTDRDNFFGVIEVSVPHELLLAENEITVTFPDNGGFVASVTLQVFQQSRELVRSGVPDIFNVHFNVFNDLDGKPLEGAEISFNDESFLSDASGHVLVDSLQAGSFAGFTVVAEGYEDYSYESFELKDNIHFQVALQPLSYHVDITIVEKELGIPVANASLTAGSSSGISNAEGTVSLTLYQGNYEVQVEKDYFATYNTDVDVSSDLNLDVELLRLMADAKFRVTDEGSGSRLGSVAIILNDTLITTNTLGLATFRALDVNQNYPYTVSREGYQDFTDQLILKKDSTIAIGLLLGLEDKYGMTGGLELYPIPASGTLHMRWYRSEDHKAIACIRDLSGRLLLEKEFGGKAGLNTQQLLLQELESGIYLLSLQTGSESITKKLLKK